MATVYRGLSLVGMKPVTDLILTCIVIAGPSKRVSLIVLLAFFFTANVSNAEDIFILPAGQEVFGAPQEYVLRAKQENLIDLALRHDLGYNEITAANPELDPWYTGAGKKVLLPTSWILPILDKCDFTAKGQFFSIQIGSFKTEENAVRLYDLIVGKKTFGRALLPRVERIKPFCSVRLGLFTDMVTAQSQLLRVKALFPEAILRVVYFQPERLVRPLLSEISGSYPELAPAGKSCIVINLAEYRLYRITQQATGLSVRTYPVGVGREGYETPTDRYRITDKLKRPAWKIPPSARANYPQYPGIIPPGPDNPLGEYALRLSRPNYLIHGTISPLGIGRRVSRGCIRMYPEDIERLFREAAIGETVVITYQPVKIGLRNKIIYLEAHEDYLGTGNPGQAALDLLKGKGLLDKIDETILTRLLQENRGIPVPVAGP